MSTRRWLLVSTALLVAVFGISPAVYPAAAGPAVTPIVGGTSFSTAVVITPGVPYSAQVVQGTHIYDYFYFDVTPGKFLTLNFATDVTWDGGTFWLYDQGHSLQLAGETINLAEQERTWRYLGNSTTPARYYFVVKANYATNNYLFNFTLADQVDGGTTGDAGDLASSAKTVTAAQGGQTVFAGNQLGYADRDDWLRIPALSGQIITITMRVTSYGALGSYAGASSVPIQITDEGGSNILAGKTIASPSTEPWIYSWMSNNTYPSAYLVHVHAATNDGTPVLYDMTVDLTQQHDGSIPGDAGDNFDTARPLTVTQAAPKLDAPGNMLGGSDQYDYYRLDLPVPGFTERPRPYTLKLDQIAWPTGSGQLTIKLYDGQRNQITGQAYYRSAPSTTPLSIDVTKCPLTGCYLYIATTVYQGNLTSYRLVLMPNNFMYLPVTRG